MKKLAIMALALMMIVGSFSACGDAKKSDKGSAENGTKFIMLDEHLNSEEYGIGFKKGNDSLRNIVNADLHELMANGKVLEIAKKYDLDEGMISLSSDITEKSEADVAAEKNRKKFIVGFDAEYPPFGYMDKDGSYVGFDLDIAAEVCKMEGWELVKNPIDWDSKDMELNSGAIDCIWNGFTIDGREKDYTWSDAYCDNSQVIVVKNGSDIKKLSDLAGKNVGVQTASAAYSVLTDSEQQKALCDTFGSLRQFGDYNVAFTELEAGSIDALAIDIGVANYQIKSRG